MLDRLRVVQLAAIQTKRTMATQKHTGDTLLENILSNEMITTQFVGRRSEITDLQQLAGRAQEVKTAQNQIPWLAAQNYFSAIARLETP